MISEPDFSTALTFLLSDLDKLDFLTSLLLNCFCLLIAFCSCSLCLSESSSPPDDFEPPLGFLVPCFLSSSDSLPPSDSPFSASSGSGKCDSTIVKILNAISKASCVDCSLPMFLKSNNFQIL